MDKILFNTPNLKIYNHYNKEINNSQKNNPVKVVNLFMDNLKKQKLLNEDDIKIYLYTKSLFKKYKIDIKDIKDIRRIKSSSKLKNKNNKYLLNCYDFFNKKPLTSSLNLVSNSSRSNDMNIKRYTLNNNRYTDKNNLPKNTSIRQKLINSSEILSQKEPNTININHKYLNTNKNMSKNNYYSPNFNKYNNLVTIRIQNLNSISYPYNLNSLNNLPLYEKDFLNITKINYMTTCNEKNKDNLTKNNINNIYYNTENNKMDSFKKEKHIRTIPMREKLKMFSFTKSNKNQNILYDKPPPNFYDKNYFYYNIYPENCGWLIKECFKHRIKWKECHSLNTNLYNFKWKEFALKNEFLDYNNNNDIEQMINHYEYNSCITNKYNLFLNFTEYCENKNIEVFKYIPFTIILDDSNCIEYSEYISNFKLLFTNINNYIFDNKSIKNQTFDRRKIKYKSYFPLKKIKIGIKTHIEIPFTHFAGKNLWIVKVPNLNRGRCIKVFNNYDKIIKYINEIIKGNVHEYDNIKEEDENKENNDNDNDNDNEKGYKYKSDKIIIQKYIEKPFLYNGRKFDIRIWVLLTHKMTAYIFKEGHLKLSSINYDLDSNNTFIHITNYSLQKHNKFFSKYEKGNEVSFETFQNYINENSKKKINFKQSIYPQFIEIIRHTIQSAKNSININKKKNCFELMGYDFLLDEEFNVFLIEINSNPGLEISSEIIKILVPRMIDDALRLTVDDIFKTDYNKEWKNEKGEYCSKYHVNGYKDEDNMWEFVCDCDDNTNKLNSINCSKKKKKRKGKKLKINKHRIKNEE